MGDYYGRKLTLVAALSLCVTLMLKDAALLLSWTCELCGIPLSSILWRVALVSTLAYFQLLLLAQPSLHTALPEIWKS